MQHLLDVNARTIALWVRTATTPPWWPGSGHTDAGWATTAFTQAGFVRVFQPARDRQGLTRVGQLVLGPSGTSPTCTPPAAVGLRLADVLSRCSGGVVRHRQVTDAYLRPPPCARAWLHLRRWRCQMLLAPEQAAAHRFCAGSDIAPLPDSHPRRDQRLDADRR